MYKKISCIATVLLSFYIFHPDRHAKNYPYVNISDIYDELIQVTSDVKSNQSLCSDLVYKEFVKKEEEINIELVLANGTFKPPSPGGEYIPSKCRPLFKSAIIVPYRNREEHLKVFIDYMHKFLQQQNIHYRIFVVEQTDNYPFNRGKLMNVGAQEAIKNDFPCLILHDVDLLPLNRAHIYACSKKPRHLASNMDTFRYHLPYLGFTGGVFSIQANQYREINGMSNRFYGWGGEDDDFYLRLLSSNLKPCRFPPEYNRYRMLRHKKAEPSDTRWDELKSALDKKSSDGFNSLSVNYTVVKKSLYTHILV